MKDGYFMRLFWIFLSASIFSLANSAEKIGLQPTEKPLAVIKADDPSDFLEVIDALLPAFPGLKAFDRQIRPPGFTAIPSLRRLLSALADAGARGFWFGVGATGASAMGWREPPSGEGDVTAEIQERLRRLGMDAARLPLRTWRDDGALSAVLGAVDEFFPGTTSEQAREQAWRNGFDAFMSETDGGIDLWANARPLSGLLALTSGLDPRHILASLGWRFPEAIVLSFFTSGDGVGARARLDGIAETKDFDPGPAAALTGVSFGDDAFLAFAVSGIRRFPGRLNGGMGLTTSPALPEAAVLALRADPDGGCDWSLAAVVDDEGAAVYGRLEKIAALVAADPRAGVETDRRQAGLLDAMTTSLGSVAFTTALKRSFGERACVLAASDGVLPDLGRAEAAAGRRTGLEIEWNADFNGIPWSRLERPVADALGGVPGGVDPAGLLALMPARETGRLSVENGNLEAYSPRLAPLWLLPFVKEQVEDFIDSFRPGPIDLAAARLRFMLDVAMQSRFRAAAPGNLTATPLPGRADWLDFSDPEVGTWLSNAFGTFPGSRGGGWTGLQAALSGRILDGYEYRLDADGKWKIVAVPAPGGEAMPVLEITAGGSVAAKTATGNPFPWREEPLITALLLASVF